MMDEILIDEVLKRYPKFRIIFTIPLNVSHTLTIDLKNIRVIFESI